METIYTTLMQLLSFHFLLITTLCKISPGTEAADQGRLLIASAAGEDSHLFSWETSGIAKHGVGWFLGHTGT